MPKRTTKRRGKGEGGIRLRGDGRYEGTKTIGLTAAGNPKRLYVYGRTRREVATKLQELHEKYDKNLLAEPSRLTVQDWLRKWIEAKTHITDKTRLSYEQMCKHINAEIGDMRVQALKPTHIQDFYTALSKKVVYQGKDRECGRKLSNRTRSYCAMILKSALDAAVSLELISKNPAKAAKLSMPRVEARAEAWTREEAATFLMAARGELAWRGTGGRKMRGRKPEVRSVPPAQAKPSGYYPIFFLMLNLGLRCGEVLGLAWQDINLDEGVIKIRRALVMPGTGNRPILKEVKTPRSRRAMYLTPDAVAVLNGRRTQQAEHYALMQDHWQDKDNLVFTTSVGTPVAPRALTRAFKQIIRIADVREIRLHDLRHTYASLAMQSRRVSIELLSERMGHANAGFTYTYRHPYESERKEAALSMDELLGGQVPYERVN